MKTYLVKLICLSGLLTVFSTCSKKEDTPPAPPAPGAIIDTAIPNGLVPGAALTLKGRDFGTVQSVKFANTTVAASDFMRTATNEFTIKVPAGTQGGAVQVVNEKGPGQPKQMTVLTGGSGLTADNVNTNVGGITQGYVTDLCSPRIFVFCYNNSCIGYYRGVARTTSGITCIAHYTVEKIAGAEYEVFKPADASHTQIILKFERSSGGTGYTGLVLVQVPNGDNYMGSILKTNSIVAYSLKDGSELKLCKPDLTGFNPNGDRLCPADRCSACR